MSRYIDADKLWNDRPQCPRGQSQEYDKGFWDCIFRFSELIRKHIDNSAAAVVEVVRCKDCRHYHDDDGGWCECHGEVDFTPEDYCSYGQRTNEET